jgi:hypothetical protein
VPTNTVLALKKSDENQAIGRGKGGLSTKIHLMVDALGNPLAFFLTPGRAHDQKLSRRRSFGGHGDPAQLRTRPRYKSNSRPNFACEGHWCSAITLWSTN